MKAETLSRQEMADNLVPIHVRDSCASILIPLNQCRRANLYLPWACEHERHSYEICLYKQYEERRQLKQQGH